MNKNQSEKNTVVFYVEKAPPPVTKPKKQSVPPQKKLADVARPNLSSQIGGFNFEGGFGDFSDLNSMSGDLIGNHDDVIMTADSVDQVPRISYASEVKFPADAKARGISGYVICNLLINPDGRVENARILESSPPSIFDDAALGAVKQWRFEAATYRGKKVAVWAKQKIRFQLN